MVCNEGIGNGFGNMFFNIRDPNFGKTNEPVKMPSEWYISTIVVTIIFGVCLIIGILGMTSFIGLGGAIGMIAGSYIIYLIFAICCS